MTADKYTLVTLFTSSSGRYYTRVAESYKKTIYPTNRLDDVFNALLICRALTEHTGT
jgi:hypothetical protein